MELDRLWLIETLKTSPSKLAAEPGVVVETCLRHLRLGFGTATESKDGAGTLFRGERAYERLLKIAAGLCSHLPGETNVFGQIKKTMTAAAQRNKELASVTAKLFEDTKFIRTQFLRGVGTQVYGEAVQRLLVQHCPDAKHVLVLGAGDMAKNVAPCLRAETVWLYNRTSARSMELQKMLSQKGQRARLASNTEELKELLSFVDAVVIGLPPLEQEEDLYACSLRRAQSGQCPACVIHLGRREQDKGPWETYPSYFSLDDVFDSFER